MFIRPLHFFTILLAVVLTAGFAGADELDFRILSNKSDKTSLKCSIDLDAAQVKVTFGLIEEMGSIPLDSIVEIEELLLASLSKELMTVVDIKPGKSRTNFYHQLFYLGDTNSKSDTNKKLENKKIIVDQKSSKTPITLRKGKKATALIKKISKICTS